MTARTPVAAKSIGAGARKATAAKKAAKPSGRAATPAKPAGRTFVVERVQTGFRMEKRMLKVLKAVAEYHDLALGDLMEGIVLHAFEGRSAFGAESLQRIADFKRLYGLELDASTAHQLTESR